MLIQAGSDVFLLCSYSSPESSGQMATRHCRLHDAARSRLQRIVTIERSTKVPPGFPENNAEPLI
jgi:hypothetical protein